jgi:mannosyltransferase OCH1-like enzyme
MILWITILSVCLILFIYIYYSQSQCKSKSSTDILTNMRNQYRPILDKPDLKDHYTITHNGNQLFILSNDRVDLNLLSSILNSHTHIHYICWIAPHDFNDIIQQNIMQTHRDTFIGLLNRDGNYTDTFIVVQKSNFALQFLCFMEKHKTQWNHLLHKLIAPEKQHSNLFYTSLFTIHYNNIECISCVNYELLNRDGDQEPSIIQTWASHFTNQDRLISCYHQIKELYPGHPYKLFSDFEMKQFILDHYDDNVRNVYDNIIPTAFKSDFFRYLYLYKYGGLYIDISVKATVNIFSHLSKTYPDTQFSFISAIDNGHPTNLWNGFIFVIPHHPIMKYCIEQITNYQNHRPLRSCLDYTGPGLLGRAYLHFLNNHKEDTTTHLFYSDNQLSMIRDNAIQLFQTKGKDNKDITKNMYKENNKSHYSLHCFHKKIFYD